MLRVTRSFWPITALSALFVITACSGDDSSTGATTASTSDSSDSDTSSTSSSTSDATTTTAGTTTTSGETDTSSSSSTDPTTTTDATTSTTDASTTDDTSTTDPTTTSGGDGVCGNGELEDGEVCDDGNLVTEAPGNNVKPHQYADGQCIDNCGLVLPTCGDGELDPGEQCDDGNQDSLDACTTSCTKNEGSYHDPCFRLCNGKTCSANDVAAGEITGCEKIVAPAGALKICYESGNVKIQGIIDKKLYFAEGDCSISAQKCTGLFCPGSATFGNYDAFNACPDGTTLVDRTTEQGGVKVQTKVCQKVCASDIECRWNAHDEFWKAPGRYRCQTTPDSKGVKICADAQNQ
jgi:cysteine-rich repeat protein